MKRKVEEIWRSVVGCENWYSVSNLGRIRREKPGQGATIGRILRSTPMKSTGYEVVQFCLGDGQHKQHVSKGRIVAEAFIGPCPAGHQVNHKNGIKTDNRAENLEWVTPSDNLKHCWRILHPDKKPIPPDPTGEFNPRAKLSDDDIPIIRNMRTAGATGKEIARAFDISRGQAAKIYLGLAWRHIPPKGVSV